jgi:hypothetical protein
MYKIYKIALGAWLKILDPASKNDPFGKPSLGLGMGYSKVQSYLVNPVNPVEFN